MKIMNFSPLKDITSNSNSSFEMAKKMFNSISADSHITKKWMGGNKDSSNHIKTKTIEAIGNVSFDSKMCYHSKNDINFVNNAINRTRAGGAIVPPKCTHIKLYYLPSMLEDVGIPPLKPNLVSVTTINTNAIITIDRDSNVDNYYYSYNILTGYTLISPNIDIDTSVFTIPSISNIIYIYSSNFYGNSDILTVKLLPDKPIIQKTETTDNSIKLFVKYVQYVEYYYVYSTTGETTYYSFDDTTINLLDDNTELKMSNLEPLTQYTFYLIPSNNEKLGTPSDVIVITTNSKLLANIPLKPIISITNLTLTSFTINIQNIDSSTIYYNFFYTDNTNYKHNIIISNTFISTITITNLKIGTNYSNIYIQAINSIGYRDSEVINNITTDSLQPTITSSDITNTTVKINVDLIIPTQDAATQILNYITYYSTSSDFNFSSQYDSVSTPISITNLINNTDYFFKVKAITSNGDSNFSTVLTVKTSNDTDTNIPEIVISSITSRSIVLNITKPTNTNYVYELKNTGIIVRQNEFYLVNLPLTISELTPNTSYEIYISPYAFKTFTTRLLQFDTPIISLYYFTNTNITLTVTLNKLDSTNNLQTNFLYSLDGGTSFNSNKLNITDGHLIIPNLQLVINNDYNICIKAQNDYETSILSNIVNIKQLYYSDCSIFQPDKWSIFGNI